MIPLNQNYKFENLNLREGEITRKDKTGQEITKRYRRDPQAQGGMAELVNIVAGLQKDVKRINQCLTLEGAKAYALKRKNWEASELDFTGPNGKPDGINEVIVTDANGNIKIINGYALAKSTYPQRKLYRTRYPTKEARKGHKYGEWTTVKEAYNNLLIAIAKRRTFASNKLFELSNNKDLIKSFFRSRTISIDELISVADEEKRRFKLCA